MSGSRRFTLAQKADVEAVLADLGVSETTPFLEVWNKVDLLDEDARAELVSEAIRRDDVVAVSALRGDGIDLLVRLLSQRLTQGHQRYTIRLAPEDGASAAWLHQHGEVLEQAIQGNEAVYEVRMSPKDYGRFTDSREGGGADL